MNVKLNQLIVLILVVVEDGLVQLTFRGTACRPIVLILVVVEDGLVHYSVFSKA